MNDITMKSQPKVETKSPAISALFFTQLFSTLAYAVLNSTLVLYATLHLGFSDANANAMMGVFGAFNFGLHLLGGYFGGRFLSNRNLFIVGMICQLLGCLVIATGTASSLYWGLSLFLTGSGLNVTCINMMLTQRFKPEDERREKAFLWNYAGMNVGFFIGFSIAAYFQKPLTEGHFHFLTQVFGHRFVAFLGLNTVTQSYQALFTLTVIGNIIAIILVLVFWKALADLNTPLRDKRGAGFFGRMVVCLIAIIVIIPILRVLLTHTQFTDYFVIILGIVVFLCLCYLTVRHRVKHEQRKMCAYLILALGSLVFWSLYQLAPMGLTLFAEHNLQRHVYGMDISPQFIQNINTIVIVIGGPLMAYLFRHFRNRGWNIDIPSQFSISLFCIGFGMLVLTLGIELAGGDGMVAFKWIVISYILQSIGELLISPIGYAMIGRLAPTRYQGVMMGSWMLVSGVASILASKFSMAMPESRGMTPAMTNPGYSHIFNQLGIAALITGVILALLIPFLRRLIMIKKSSEAVSES